MADSALAARFDPLLTDVADRSRVTDAFLDRDVYRLYISTLWANVVINPEDAGVTADDLEALHELINNRIEQVLGAGQTIRSCFEFVNSKAGELAMQQARLTQNHKDLLLYFASMILDPDGHQRWMDSLREDP